MNILCWDPQPKWWTGRLLCTDSPNPTSSVDRHCYPLLSFLLMQHQYPQSIPSHPIQCCEKSELNMSAKSNNEKLGLVWCDKCCFCVCVLFHWSSFLHFRVARRLMWVFKEHLWKGHCDSLLRTFKKKATVTMWDPHVIHILGNILLFLYVRACVFCVFKTF